MSQGVPGRVAEEYERRRETVKVLITLNRGQIEDLELIGRYRHGQRSRSLLVREAVGWLLAREAMSLVRYQQIEERHRLRAELDAQALIVPSSERQRRKLQETLNEARRIASTKGER